MPPLPAPLVRLQASGCNLHQLPPFPEHSQLEHLDIGDNRLARIPPLPQSLRVLVANKNSASHLQSLILPDLPRWLTRVDLSACNLTELPALPENLEHANFARNRISTLSQPTQPSVTWLKVSDNPNAELPEWVLLLSPQAEVRLSKEYMSKRAYQTITRQVMAARTEGTGPRFIATGWSDFGVEEDIGFWR